MNNKRQLVCSGCKDLLPCDLFYVNRNTKRGYTSRCIDCFKKYYTKNQKKRAKYYKKNQVERNNYQREYDLQNKESILEKRGEHYTKMKTGKQRE